MLIGNDIPDYWHIDRLYGGDGDDTLIGLAGNDILAGGAGADTMVGGSGIDTYYIEGHDRIIDVGQNNIIWNGKLIAGVFKEVDGNPGTYTFISDDQEYCLAFHSPGQLTLSDTDSVTFVNQTSGAAFADNDFGITLTEKPSTDFTYFLTGTAYRNEMAVDTLSSRDNWTVLCFNFPPGVEENTPFFERPLPTTAPRMKITGGASGDYLMGFVRHDEINGGDGGDIIMGNVEVANGKLLNLSGPLEGDLIDGGNGGDMLTGSGGDDQIFGGEGNDFLGGLNGEDILLGEAGNDVLAGASHADSLSGGDGDDLLFGDGYIGSQGEEPFNLTLDNLSSLGVQYVASASGYYTGYVTTGFAIRSAPNGGDDLLMGGAGRDMLYGGEGNDTLDGGTENDSLFGNNGDDWLFGGEGADWLVGDNGEDLSGEGNDTLDGDSGNDLLYGLGGNDTLRGGDGDDVLLGFSGDDVLDGGDGKDVLLGDNGDNSGSGNDTLYGGGGEDILQGAGGGDSLYGGSEADSLFGQNDNDTLYGEQGNDELQGGGGDDFLDGGAGADLLFGDNGDGSGIGKDTLLGGDGDDELQGGGGNDYLDGGDDNDLLLGNSGNDILYGGDGNDELQGHGGSDELHGDAGDDNLFGFDGDDLLVGGSGSDYLAGGSGANRFVFQTGDGEGDGDFLNVEEGSNLIEFADISLDDIEIQLGSTDDHVIIQYSTTDRLTILHGRSSSNYNFLIDGTTYSYAQLAAVATVALSGTAGNDSLAGGSGSDILYGRAGDDVLEGSEGADKLYGEIGQDSLYGGDGDDLLQGGLGYDKLFGGQGNDQYLFFPGDDLDYVSDTEGENTMRFATSLAAGNFTFSFARDQNGSFIKDYDGDGLLIGNSQGNTVFLAGGRSAANFSFTFADVVLSHADILERTDRNLQGDAGNNTIEGKLGNDILNGNGGNDVLIGGAGADFLYGGEGDDLLIGGAGADYLDGGLGEDTVSYADDTAGVTVHLWGTGSGGNAEGDVYKDIENVIGGKGADTLWGDGYNILEGGPGADMLIGKHITTASYRSSSAGVTVNLGTGEAVGGDAEGDTFERIYYLIGSEHNDSLTGIASLWTQLTGLGGDDVLRGSGDGDQLDGGKGNDVLLGGGSCDTYVFNRGDGTDTILDSKGHYEQVEATDRFGHQSTSEVWIEEQSDEDRILFGNGITSEDLLLYRDSRDESPLLSEDDLVIALKDPGNPEASWQELNDKIIIQNYFSHEVMPEINIFESRRWWHHDPFPSQCYGEYFNSVESLEFSDYSTLDYDEIVAKLSVATAGNDLLEMVQYIRWNTQANWNGLAGDDILIGASGNDTLLGGEGDDRLDGRGGVNFLDGGAGDDTYVITNRNIFPETSPSGDKVVQDTIADESGIDRVLFANDIAREDVVFTLSVTGDLIVDYGLCQQHRIVIAGNAVETFEMADGSTIAREGILAALTRIAAMTGKAVDDITSADIVNDISLKSELYNGWTDRFVTHYGHDDWNNFSGNSENEIVYGGAGIDDLRGHCGNDELHGGASDDILNGGNGNDRYVFGRGDQNDTIYDLEKDYITDDYGNFEEDDGDYQYLMPWRGIWQVHPNAAASNDTLLLTGDIGKENLEIYWTGSSEDPASDDLLIRIRPNDDNQAWHLRENNIAVIVDHYNANHLEESIFNPESGEYEEVARLIDTSDLSSFDDKALRHLAYQVTEGGEEIAQATSFAEVMGYLTDENLRAGFNREYRSGEDTILLKNYYDRSQTVENVTLESSGYTLTTADILDLMSTESSEMIRGFDWEANTVHAGGGNDIVYGGTLDDTLFGDGGNDTLQGGAGDDMLSGGSGDDTYLFNIGDGVDRITDSDGTDTIRFGAGITADSLSLGLGSLLIRVGDQGDAIHLEDFNPEDPVNSSATEKFEFADGTLLEVADLLQRGFDISGSSGDDLLRGTALVDRISGGAGDDTLVGGKGDDVLTGGEGRDCYVAKIGDGVDLIVDEATAGGANTVLFGEGIGRKDITVATEGSTLTIGYDTLGSQLVVENFDPAGAAGSMVLDTFVFADGSSFTYQDLINRAPEVADHEDVLLQDIRATAGRIAATDPDGDSLFFSLQSGPAYGDFVMDEQGAWQYRPHTLFIGTDQAVVTIDDGNGGVASTTLQFDVRVSPPTVAEQLITLDEDTDSSGVLPVENPVGGTLVYQVTGEAGHGFFAIDDNGTWQYKPEGNYHGEDSVSIKVTNEYGLNAETTLALTVAPVNDVPLVVAEERFVLLALPVLGGQIKASDVDGDSLRFNVSTAPEHGVLTVDEAGRWQYWPAAGYFGWDWAEVAVSDGAGGVATTRLSFLVNTYTGGDLNLPEETVAALDLQGIGKADLHFAKDGSVLVIDIREKGTIRMNGYFAAPENGLRFLHTTDGAINLEKECIVEANDPWSVLNGVIHGLLGERLLVDGTSRSDFLSGALDNDVLFGSGGNDHLLGLWGNDTLIGGSGNDFLSGNDGTDTLYGDQGNDKLFGGAGDDFLIGGEGNDQLYGEAGSDLVAGGAGNDRLTGGAGSDTFLFDSVLDKKKNKDTITDFVSGQDKIALDSSIFILLPEEGTLASYFQTNATGSAQDDNDYLLYNTTSGALLYDTDGSGQGLAVEFATLTNKPTIKTEDFVLVS